MKYEILEDKVVIMGYDQDGLSVEIPEMIEGHAVTELAPYAFSGTDIEEIILPKTVAKIGRYAFYNCKNLRRISFYNTMKDLGAGAFTNVHNVREIEISFVDTKKSCLREFLIELPEEQNITFHFDMEKAKRKICLITTWYPTKNNPYKGVFFKDQAFALEEDFDFTVVHYKEKKKDPILVYALRCLLGKNISITEVNRERNTTEYDVNVYLPGYLTISNMIYDWCSILKKGTGLTR